MGEVSEGGSRHKGNEAMTPLLPLANGRRGSPRRAPGLCSKPRRRPFFGFLWSVCSPGWSPETPSQRLTKSQLPAIYQSLVDSNESPAYFYFYIYLFIFTTEALNVSAFVGK